MMLFVHYLTLSHQFSCQNDLPLCRSHPQLLYFTRYLFLRCHFSTESPWSLSGNWGSSFQWHSIWTEVKSKAFAVAWTTPPCYPLSYFQALQEQPLFIFKHTESFPAQGSELSSLCQKHFPVRRCTADSLASFRSLLRPHLKRAMAADSLEQSKPRITVSFHGFITLFVLCCRLEHCPFVCLLALSSLENVSWKAGTFCYVYFCVSSVWLIVGACVSRANGQAAHAQGGWNSVYVGILPETGAITSPLLLIALPGTAQRSSEYRC